MSRALAALAGLLALVPIADCADRERRDDAAGVVGVLAPPADGMATGVSSSEARFVRNVIGFNGPESVRYDAEQDVFFVSNMMGYGSFKDGNGYIVRFSAAHPDSAVIFVQGGRNGATLDAPKGMTIHGDTLWVADIDKLRGFDRRTGAPLATLDFAPQGAVLLNDVDVGADGTLRVTDTGILMNKAGVVHTGPDRIFAVGPGATISVVSAGTQLRQPNGIHWDSAGGRWIVVSFDPFAGEVAAMPATGAGRTVLRTGTGRLDGVELLPDGAILFASWADSSVHLLAGGDERQLVRQVPAPADIGLDTRRNRLAIPLSTLGRVQLWSLGAIGRGARADSAARR
ncbi:MAG TPA: SMP-30/gluconolactonase/LRE family protein [Gemmatimonadaceae bacterium]|nr:SMP-30/gluconolactonase/LRE family protein [Gemmatimonadaceae bacterium]